MGEEAKKPDEKKPPEEGKYDNKTDVDDGKNKSDAPPQDIVLKVYMHCEGCARKVRRCLKGFDGVEEVVTDCRTNKVVVKGEKADPTKVMERVQRKSHRQVELISPIPKPTPPSPPPQEDKKPESSPEQTSPPEKKEEPKVVTVVLKVHMHCDACAQVIKKRILRMKGVESAEPDLKASEVTVTGVFEPAKLVEYVHKRTGKNAGIVKQDPPPPAPPEDEKKEAEAKEGDSKEAKKKEADGGGGKNEEVGAAAAAEGKKGQGEEEGKKQQLQQPESATMEEEVEKLGLELKRNEHLYYPPYYLPRFVPAEYHGGSSGQHPYPYPPYQYQYQVPPPQIFSDENPNACSVM